MTIEKNVLDPQRWNRYAYARNNPLRYSDPTGLYTCEGGSDVCKRVDQYVSTLKTSLDRLDSRSDGYKKIQRVLQYFGDRNVRNGVVFEPTTLGAGVTGQALDNGRIQLDLANIEWEAEGFSCLNGNTDWTAAFGAATLAHEGRHELDSAKFGLRTSGLTELRTELNAYWTDSYVFEGLRVSGATWVPGVDAETRAALVNAAAQRSTEIWCLKSRACR